MIEVIFVNTLFNVKKSGGSMKNKKNNKILIYIISILGIILISLGIFFLVKQNSKNDEATENEKTSLKDDFYKSINEENFVNLFLNAQIDTNKNLIGTISEIEEDVNFTDENYMTFIEQFEDYEKREENGLKDLNTYFEKIDNAKTLDDFSDILVKINYDLGVNSFINWEIMPDFYDNSKNVITFSPMILENLNFFLMANGLNSGLEFFSNDKYDTYKEVFEKNRVNYFKVYGYDEEKATKVSKDISDFAKIIQEKSLSIDELYGNYLDYYKTINLNELKSIIKNLPIDKLLNKYGLDNYNNYAILDEGHIKALDNYYTSENLPLMKEILKLLVLENVASLYTTKEYADIFTNVYSTLSGEKANTEIIFTYFEYVKLKPRLMGKYLNIKYDEKYFTEVEKLEIVELINKIKDYYIKTINSSNWLSDATKQEAIKKINNLTTNVGYVQKDDFENPSKLIREENGGNLLSNYILLYQGEASLLSKKINKKINEEVDQFVVNAYYNPTDNSINFPSAFREVYRNFKDKYEIYAYVGIVIGHEISHAFDNIGSKYDEYGNVKEWWTEEDRASYDTLKQKIIDYYSKYEFMGYKVDGEKTVGENIADLAGLKTIISIMDDENASKEDYIKFFESYAKLWAIVVSKEEAKLQMLSDPHSPNKVRVNAVLSSMDKFYEIYDIKEEDKMFVPKEERVGLW